MSTEHTVLLIQFDQNDAHSRTYLDFDTVADAMDSITQMYENKIRLGKVTTTSADVESDSQEDLQYEMRGLVSFLDGDFSELTCLVFDEVQKIYVPHGKEWIKSRIYQYLKKYAPSLQNDK